MHSYAISINNREAVWPSWQNAISHAEIRKIEYSAGDDDFDVFRHCVEALDSMQQSGSLEVASIHIPFGPFSFWTHASTDEAERREGVRRIREFLSICRVLGCRNYTIHGSGEPIVPENRSQAMASLRRSLLELSEDMDQLGASLNLELLPRSCIGNTPEELLQAMDGMPQSIGICLDVNHLCGAPERVPAAIPLLGERLRSFHISDYDGVDECHWFPGFGVLDWPAIMAQINNLPQELLLIFEIGRLKAAEWQNRAVSPEIHCHDCALTARLLENGLGLLHP